MDGKVFRPRSLGRTGGLNQAIVREIGSKGWLSGRNGGSAAWLAGEVRWGVTETGTHEPGA